MPGQLFYKFLFPATAGSGRTDANDAADEYAKADTLLRRVIAALELSPKAQKEALKSDAKLRALLSAVSSVTVCCHPCGVAVVVVVVAAAVCVWRLAASSSPRRGARVGASLSPNPAL